MADLHYEDGLLDDGWLVALALVRAVITSFRAPAEVSPLQEVVQPFLDLCRSHDIPVDQAFGRLVTQLSYQAAGWFAEAEGQCLGHDPDEGKLLAKLEEIEMGSLAWQEARRRADGSD